MSKFEIHMQELKNFWDRHPKAFLSGQSFSQLSCKGRKELSIIYFHLAKAIIENSDSNTTKENQLKALDYLNTSISLDAIYNSKAYIMIAKIYAAIGNPICAYANILIATVLIKTDQDAKFFIQQCKKLPFPPPQKIWCSDEDVNELSLHWLREDKVLILRPGTYTATFPICEKSVVIIGIAPPICICSKATLSMDKCVVANSTGDNGGILIANDSKAKITNCNIYNIGLSALEVRHGSSLYVENNEIHHSSRGVTAWLNAKEIILINNDIYNNLSEGILVHGYREPASSKEFNKFLHDYIHDSFGASIKPPPPRDSYTKPSQTLAVLQNNRILKNGSFGVSVDFGANVRMENNEIADCITSGCIIKGGTDADILNNNIHNNRTYGIEVGVNYHGKVVIKNNSIHSNKRGNITCLALVEMIDNEIGVDYLDESNDQNFINFNISSNRPGIHLFYEESLLYAISNTYGFNLLKNFTTKVTSTTGTTIFDKKISIFLGGINDLSNIVETVYDLTMSLESHTNYYNINLLFTINNFNPIVLSRNLVLLEMINRLPDPKPPSSLNEKGIYGQWNKNFVIGVMEILSVWAEKVISDDTYNNLNSCIHSLIESLENKINIKTNKCNNDSSNKKLPSWISFKHSSNTEFFILQTLQYWKNNSLSAFALNWDANHLFSYTMDRKFSPEIEILRNLKERYYVDEDIKEYACCQLPISNQARSYINVYSNTLDKPNVTMLTVPAMEYNVSPTSCIFRTFQLASLRASLHKTSSVQIQVKPVLGDIIDTLLCRLPPSVRFNAIDCSNLADHVSLLNIIFAAAPKLKDNSQLTLQLIKVHNPSDNSMKKFVEQQLGLSLNILSKLTGITFVNAYSKDYAVYVTWKFDIAKDKEEKLDTLINGVISVASACCTAHNKRIYGLSINIIVRLFQIMNIRFSEEIMAQLLQSLFTSKGFNKYIPNFAMHLVELKTFMTLHFCLPFVSKLKELNDLKVPIARYSLKWETNKIVKEKMHTLGWYFGKHRKTVCPKTEMIWLRLIKPIKPITHTSNFTTKKNKRNNYTSKNREPNYYYFDSVSISSIKAPTIMISFHLPIPFYDNHKDWILEFNIGSRVILSSAEMITLSKVTQKNVCHNMWDSETEYKEYDEVNVCKRCRKYTTKICSKCKSVYYCSKNCQEDDLKRHSKVDCIKVSSGM
ncbi:12222_t:CDS:2 [Rhizophagus irregularis]|nr:12222_t:CDS:2 [Rhizophagus irregularis]